MKKPDYLKLENILKHGLQKPEKLPVTQRVAKALAKEPKTMAEFCRLLSGRSQEAIAKRAGVMPSEVNYVEHGHFFLTPAEKAKLAKVLGCPVELLGEKPTPEARAKWTRGVA